MIKANSVPTARVVTVAARFVQKLALMRIIFGVAILARHWEGLIATLLRAAVTFAARHRGVLADQLELALSCVVEPQFLPALWGVAGTAGLPLELHPVDIVLFMAAVAVVAHWLPRWLPVLRGVALLTRDGSVFTHQLEFGHLVREGDLLKAAGRVA